MATINTKKRKNGSASYQIQFFVGKSRKTLSLDSKYTVKQAKEIKYHVERIAQAVTAGREFSELPRATRGFVEDMTDDLKARFMRAGLLDETESATIGEVFKRFTNEAILNPDIKESTLRTYKTAKKRFLSFFDANRLPETISKEDGMKWKAVLLKRYAKATVLNSLVRVGSVFNWAIGKGLITVNPFTDLKKGLSYENPENKFYISLDWYHKLLDACPCQTWRTILALCRIGGLRNPSETLRLTWHDVDWKNQTILVHSPKTEHHKGRGARLIPMFPGLREELEAQMELAKPGGSPYVIPDFRDSSVNMRKYLNETIVFRAGLPVWRNVFNNLRASASTDVITAFGPAVESVWVGHSPRIAQNFYFQVTDEILQRALNWNPQTVGKVDEGQNGQLPKTTAVAPETTAKTTALPC